MRLADERLPVIMANILTDESGFNMLVQEIDFALQTLLRCLVNCKLFSKHHLSRDNQRIATDARVFIAMTIQTYATGHYYCGHGELRRRVAGLMINRHSLPFILIRTLIQY